MIKKDGFYVFEKLVQFPQIVHGISTKHFGSVKRTDPKRQKNIESFAKAVAFNAENLYTGVQVHSGNVLEIHHTSEHNPENTDGSITTEKDIVLGVVTADCVPVLLYDPVKGVVGTVHAGYKGIQNKIVHNSIQKFKEAGSQPEDIIACIGPSICVCCYNVMKERIEAFENLFPGYQGFFEIRDGTYYLSLESLVIQNLTEYGLGLQNIEVSNICTVDHTDEFYSYRKEGEESGRFLSVIGLKG